MKLHDTLWVKKAYTLTESGFKEPYEVNLSSETLPGNGGLTPCHPGQGVSVIQNLVAQSQNSRLGQPMLIAILLNLSLPLFCETPLAISHSHSEDRGSHTKCLKKKSMPGTGHTAMSAAIATDNMSGLEEAFTEPLATSVSYRIMTTHLLHHH